MYHAGITLQNKLPVSADFTIESFSYDMISVNSRKFNFCYYFHEFIFILNIL